MTAGDHDDVLLIDDPAPRVRRLTLNRPEKRNALNDALRVRCSMRCAPAIVIGTYP